MTKDRSENGKYLITKAHKVYGYFHTTCGEFVRGEGSIVFPYRCSCGEWEYDMETHNWRLKDGK